MAKKILKIKKIRKKSSKGKFKEVKLINGLMKEVADHGLYSITVPFAISEEVMNQLTEREYQIEGRTISWAVQEEQN